MAEGSIKRLTDKGFGFISTGGSKDLFFHASSLEGAFSCAVLASAADVQFLLKRNPAKQAVVLLRGVVGVQDDRYAVGFGHHVDMVGTGDRTQHRAVLLQPLAGVKGGAAVGKLDDHR